MPENKTTAGRPWKQQAFLFTGILINTILIITQSSQPITRPQPDIESVEIIPNPTFPPRIPPVIDSPKWLPIIIVCGRGEMSTAREMEPLVKSAMLLSSAPLHFVLVTDYGSFQYIQRLFENQLPYTKTPIQVDIWIISEDSVNTFASLLQYDPTYHHSGIWGTSKLMLPWIVKNVDRAIMIDTDMIFLDDPARLWDEFYPTNSDGIDNGNHTSSWLYKMPLHGTEAPHTICSCIILLKMDQIRQSNVFPTLMEEALASQPTWALASKRRSNGKESLYETPNGDQGLYWAMLKQNDTLVAALPDRWNVDRCNSYFGALTPESKRPVSVMHNNCDRSDDFGLATDYFKFYEEYKWHWLKGDGESPSKFYKVNVTVHAKETQKLQDLFHCLKEKKEYILCAS